MNSIVTVLLEYIDLCMILTALLPDRLVINLPVHAEKGGPCGPPFVPAVK